MEITSRESMSSFDTMASLTGIRWSRFCGVPTPTRLPTIEGTELPILNSSSVVNPFDPPYEIWSERPMTPQEMLDYAKEFGHFASTIKNQLLGRISNPVEAAKHMVEEAVDEKLNSHLQDGIDSSSSYDSWRRAMPRQTPPAIAKYQKHFPDYDSSAVDDAIFQIDFRLPLGQALFHGGIWPNSSSNSLVTDRPLSTTLLPSVALRNAEHKGKAYHAGEIQLMVLTIRDLSIRSFVFRKSGTLLGHEHEVLLPSGIKLTIRNRICVREDYPSGLDGIRTKPIPGVVLEVDVG